MINLELYNLQEASEYLSVKPEFFNKKYYLYLDYVIYGFDKYYTKEHLDKAFEMERLYNLKDTIMPDLETYDIENNKLLLEKYLGNEISICEFDKLKFRKSKNFLNQNHPSIYCLLNENEVVYVGRTKNLFSRLTDHKYGEKDFNKIHVLFYDNYLDFEKAERLLVIKHCPKYNYSYLPDENKKIIKNKS